MKIIIALFVIAIFAALSVFVWKLAQMFGIVGRAIEAADEEIAKAKAELDRG